MMEAEDGEERRCYDADFEEEKNGHEPRWLLESGNARDWILLKISRNNKVLLTP